MIKVGFEIIEKINKKKFDLTWNVLTKTDDLMVGEDVKIIADVQLIKKI